MSLKTSVGRLYMLFNACLPDNDKIQKRLSISELLETKEYLELKAYLPFSDIFDNYFSQAKLSECDIDKLNELKKAIPRVIPTIEKLINAIKYGNACELTEADLPDFYSVTSLNKLYEKLNIQETNPNITNITFKNFMNIFSDSTIKNPEDILKDISMSDIKNPKALFIEKAANKLYCVREKDITSIKEQYMNKIDEIDVKKAELKKVKKSLKWRKISLIVTAIFILVAINNFELLSMNSIEMFSFMLGSILLIILYLIIG